MCLLDGDCLIYGNEEGVYSAWATNTAYISGDIVTSDVYSGGGVYINQTATCTSGATAPSGTSPVSDGACTWAYAPGASLAGDSMGDANSNIGAVERWVGEDLGLNFVNIGRGSDRYSFRTTKSNWLYRLYLAQLANPTDYVEELGHNDLTGAGSSAAQIASYANSTFGFVKSFLPNVSIFPVPITPGSTSSDIFRTTTNQTAETYFGNSSSNRGVFNDSYVRNCSTLTGTAGFIDFNPALEDGYTEGTAASETSLWNVTGKLQGFTPDGTHWNSYGSQQGASGVYAANASCQQVTNPF
jgi:hypothetical protein